MDRVGVPTGQTRVREYLDHIRKTASIKDHRKEIQSANRQASAS